MAKANRKCKLCGKEYYFCPQCNDNLSNPKPAWFGIYHDINCKNIFDILVKYSTKRFTKDEAYVALNACDLSDVNNYDEDAQKLIHEIVSSTNEKKEDKESEKKRLKFRSYEDN